MRCDPVDPPQGPQTPLRRRRPSRYREPAPVSSHRTSCFLASSPPRLRNLHLHPFAVTLCMLSADKVSSIFSCTRITSSICSCSILPPCTSCGANQQRTFLFCKSPCRTRNFCDQWHSPAHSCNTTHGGTRVDQDRSGFAGPFGSRPDTQHGSRHPRLSN